MQRLETLQQRTNNEVQLFIHMNRKAPQPQLVPVHNPHHEREMQAYERAQALKSLGENPDPSKVEEIMQSTNYTKIQCSSCNKLVEDVVIIVDTHEENTWDQIDRVSICKDCASNALKLFTENA